MSELILGMLALAFFAGLGILVYVHARIQAPAHVEQKLESQRLARELSPAYQAGLEAEHRREMQRRDMRLKEMHAALQLYTLPTPQYGGYVHPDIATRWIPVAPIHKPLQLKPGDPERAPTALAIPVQYDLREVWCAFMPSAQQIFLGRSAAGDILVPGNKLLHCIATGPTGGGKTNTVRMILMQLVYIGCQVTLCDIHYAPIKEDESGQPIDWRPIVERLARPPIYDLAAIVKWMNWLAFTELQGRIDKQRENQPIGAPIFFTIAELPAVLDEAGKDIAQPLAKILRQGRQYQIFFVGDSQDLLTETLHMTTGPRECFRTGYYTGGDPTTAKALLDLPKGVTLDETGIGQGGLMYLKTAIHPYQLARVGWASNEALYDLFGTPANQRLAPARSYYAAAAVTPDETEVRAPGKRTQRDFDERNTVEADSPESDLPDNITTFPDASLRPPGEPTQRDSVERNESKYNFTDEEITRFKQAYRTIGNIDDALSAIGKGTHYRAAARRVIQAYGLREEA